MVWNGEQTNLSAQNPIKPPAVKTAARIQLTTAVGCCIPSVRSGPTLFNGSLERSTACVTLLNVSWRHVPTGVARRPSVQAVATARPSSPSSLLCRFSPLEQFRLGGVFPRVYRLADVPAGCRALIDSRCPRSMRRGPPASRAGGETAVGTCCVIRSIPSRSYQFASLSSRRPVSGVSGHGRSRPP